MDGMVGLNLSNAKESLRGSSVLSSSTESSFCASDALTGKWGAVKKLAKICEVGDTSVQLKKGGLGKLRSSAFDKIRKDGSSASGKDSEAKKFMACEKATEADLSMPEIVSFPDLSDYKIVEKIGEGAFSVVYKAIYKCLGCVIALKIISKESLDSKQHNNVFREVTLIRGVDHPNVVKLLDFKNTPSNYVIVLEHVNGGELYAALVRDVCFPEDVCRHIILQVGEALRYLHKERGIVHRDIKLENILFYPSGYAEPELLTNQNGCDMSDYERIVADPDAGRYVGVIKIADFGLSKAIFDASTVTPCGTVGYTAPEVLKDGVYSKGVDIWALGCVLYTLLCGFPPFFDDSPKELAEKVSQGLYTFISPWWDSISIESKDLIFHLLDTNPNERYTITQFLEHPWLNGLKFPPSYKPSGKFAAMISNSCPDSEFCPTTTQKEVTMRRSFSAELPTIHNDIAETPQREEDLHPGTPNTQYLSCIAEESENPQSAHTANTSGNNHQRSGSKGRCFPPFDVYSRDLVSAPLNVYNSIMDKTESWTTAQLVRIYNGGGVVPEFSEEKKPQPQESTSVPAANTSPQSQLAPVEEVKILHRFGRDVKTFKLNMNISPLYNRRRGMPSVGFAN